MNPLIEVIQIRAVAGQGNLRAFADVRIGEITIYDCRVIQQHGQKAFVHGPHKESNGRWLPLVTMTTELRQLVQEQVIPRWQKQEASNA